MEPTRIQSSGAQPSYSDGGSSAKVTSLNQALRVLSDASADSAEEIRGMVNRDFKVLKKIFSGGTSEVKSKFSGLKEATLESIGPYRERINSGVKQVDRSVHDNAWTYIAGAAAISVLLGFLIGRKSS